VRADWRPEPWVALRVAGLPADVISGLELHRSADLASRLAGAEKQLGALARTGVTTLFDAVSSCHDVPQRRLLLRLKRRLYGAAAIGTLLNDIPLVRELSPDLQAELAAIAAVEAEVERLSDAYESVYAEELLTVEATLRRRIVGSDWLGDVLLSSGDLWQAARWLETPAGAAGSRRLRQESALARYLFRSALRTAPFGGFAAVALLRLPTQPESAPSMQARRHWHSTAQIHHQALQRWISHRLDRTALRNLPLRPAPVRQVEQEPPVVSFPVFSAVGTSVRTEHLGPLMQRVLSVAEGRSTNDVCDALAGTAEEAEVWGQLVDSMVAIGMLTRDLPRTTPDQAGLLELARQLDQLGAAALAGPVRQLAEVLARFPGAAPASRAAHIVKLRDSLGLEAPAVPLYVDRTLSGIRGQDVGITAEELTEVLRPALALARVSASDQPHRRLCEAFLARFGADGVCRDVPAFLTELSRDGRLLSRLRRVDTPVSWLDSAVGRAARTATGTCASIDAALFEQLAVPEGPCALAAFVQLEATDRQAMRSGDYQVVLNGIQSGRHKYLSRYLGGEEPATQAARQSIQERLATADDPMPVEIMPLLGLNFQVHPQLTSWALEIPGDANPQPAQTIPLADLVLRFDPATARLRVSSTRLGRDIEPVHLGFLRDLNLPDELLLIRALSPRIAEDTVAERVKVYGVLDRVAAAGGRPLPRHRPRLEVGRLVLERARWAIPVAELPRPDSKGSSAANFRRLATWREENGLPARGFVRWWGPRMAHAPAQYLDWENPFALAALQRIGPKRHEPLPDEWLLFDELLPRPENALLDVNGRPHVAELLVHFEAGV
jgi:hypothetical protein